MAIDFSLYDAQIKSYVATNYVPVGGSIATNVANTLYVATDGNDANSGSAVKPLKTISHALSIATSGTVIYVYSGIYNENILLKAGVSLIGSSKYQTIINGMTTANMSNNGFAYLNNLLLKNGDDTALDFVGTINKQTLIVNNCNIESTVGNSGYCINYTNENENSSIELNGTTINAYSTLLGAKGICVNSTSAKGKIIVNNSNINCIDTIDGTAIQIIGSVSYSQSSGIINGQTMCSDTGSIDLINIISNTDNVSNIVTNSSSMTTCINSRLNTNYQYMVSGYGNFNYNNIISDKSISNLTNGGLGGVSLKTNGIMLNSAQFVTDDLISTGNANGLFELYDNSLSVILNNSRKVFFDYDYLDNKPTFPTKTTDLINDSNFINVSNLIAGTNITIVKDTDSNDITINSTGGGGGTTSDGKVKINSNSTADYLENLIDGTTVTIVNDKITSTGGSLSTLSDVNLTSPTNDQLLVYNSTSSKVENKNFADVASSLKYPTVDDFEAGANVSLSKSANNKITINASVDTSGLATDSELTSGLSGKADINHTHAYNTITGTPDLSIYVQKDGTKVLSDNNYSTVDKTKVDGIKTDGLGTKYQADDGTYKEIVLPTSAGGYSSNMYFLSRNSTADANFKGLSYIPETSEVLKTTTVNNNEILMGQYLFDSQVGVNVVNAGEYRFLFHGYSSSSIGTNKLRIVAFMRSETGTEQELFSIYSDNIINTTSQEIKIEVIKGIYSIDSTSHIGFRIYASTTNTTDTTITINVGGDNSAYLNTPLALRHDQLRQGSMNADPLIQHITQTQKDELHSHPNLNLILNNLGTIGDNLLSFNNKAVVETLDTTDLMKVSDYATGGQAGIVDKATAIDSTGSSPLQVYGTDASGTAMWMNYPIVIPSTSTLTQRVLYNLTTDVPKTIPFSATNPLHQLIIQCYEEIQEQAISETSSDYTKTYATTKTNDVVVDTTGTYVKDNYLYNFATTSDLYGYVQKESEEINVNNYLLLDSIV